jgi:hypothetical protein
VVRYEVEWRGVAALVEKALLAIYNDEWAQRVQHFETPLIRQAPL